MNLMIIILRCLISHQQIIHTIIIYKLKDKLILMKNYNNNLSKYKGIKLVILKIK